MYAFILEKLGFGHYYMGIFNFCCLEVGKSMDNDFDASTIHRISNLFCIYLFRGQISSRIFR